MRAVPIPHNHLRFSMCGLSLWHPTLCPDEDDSAAGIAPLILRRGTEEVRVDFDRENLRWYERDRGGLDRWRRVVYAVDEVGGSRDRSLLEPLQCPAAVPAARCRLRSHPRLDKAWGAKEKARTLRNGGGCGGSEQPSYFRAMMDELSRIHPRKV